LANRDSGGDVREKDEGRKRCRSLERPQEIVVFRAPFFHIFCGIGANGKIQLEHYEGNSVSLRIVIAGLGQVGWHLAKVLSMENHDVIAIESSTSLCDQARESLDIEVHNGSVTDSDLLTRIGIESTDLFIALTGSDELNILACQMAERFGVPKKIARIRNLHFFEKEGRFSLKDWGVDIAIQPELETAREIVLLIKRSAATDVLEFADGHLQLVGIRLDTRTPVLNKPLMELTREHPDVLFRIVAILRNERTIIPTGKDILFRRDQVFILAETGQISRIVQLLGKAEEKLDRVIILGGGKIGRETAKLLEQEKNIEIKLIESNPDKSLMIADQLEHTMVIQGDGRDFDLLASEGIMEMDVLISVTDDEETNILTCLLARHLGVRKTIALVNKEEYLPIMAPIGIDAAVNTNRITSNTILSLIRRGQVLSVASLPGIEAEILEYRVPKGARITKAPLNKIKFPKGAIVGAITRGKDVIIPVGETRILPDDRVVVFSLPQAFKDVEKLFLK